MIKIEAGDGLASVTILDDEGRVKSDTVFSFSEKVWRDMLDGYMVIEQDDKYIIYHFRDTDKLPRPDQQRSVLIKNFVADIISEKPIAKSKWASAHISEQILIDHYRKNNNHHTTSDFNYVGLRVLPNIIF